MLTCNECNPDGVNDLGWEQPDLRAQWVASVDHKCCPDCGNKDIKTVVEGSHWYCEKCKDEFYDTVTARCHIVREWLSCPDCDEHGGSGMYYVCRYILTLPDKRTFKLNSESECEKIFKALYPGGEYDREWADDRRTMYMENGGRW